MVGSGPTMLHQRGLDLGQPGFRHHDVDVGVHAAGGRRVAGHQVGRALHQRHRYTQRRDGAGQKLDFAPDFGLLGARQHQHVMKVLAHARRRRHFFVSKRSHGDTRQHVALARLAHQQFPLRHVQRGRGVRVAQHAQQQVVSRRFHC